MKKILKLMLVALCAIGGWSCELTAPEEPQGEELEVTTNNISGSWKLAKWNGEALPEDNYVYIDFVRADGTYTMYQNIDSFSTRVITGRYTLYVDEEVGAAVLRGDYDHGAGEWNHRYIIDHLTRSEMRLVAKDNAEDICLYERCEIPSEIVGE
jgi:hypothetical protein